ncbi:L-proline glycine betaine ABC transport system permease protein ProW [Desulfocucumis palustris]|uniref:L-proline glycine betaine ABC transport system permease protein ProW n=1 Tax=Desulfocucumis palustris TaxID=1898651 RepID=A0A2L2XAC7_9FIRM|nr:ABC transporter permease subunit [Desulfocucumis palustris]GBF32593.1 L-proline glycine betaine ABC transport system permease protein ProW [Desulfocucumis palustris]
MFPEMLQFHIASYIDVFVKWLTVEWGSTFNVLTNLILLLLLKIQSGLMFVPWWLWIAAVAAIRWLQTRRLVKTAGLIILLMAIGVFGLWAEAMETLAIVITSVTIAFAISIPLGIAMAESDRINAVATPLLDAMQTMPSFVYLIPALMLFGLGKVPAVIATLIYAVPPLVRLTNLGIRQVSASVQEAAGAFGATRWQIMREVRLPLAMPSILAGLNQTTMMALAMVVIASMIGAGGLGEKVLISINRIAVGNGFEAGFAVVALAIVIDRTTQGLARRWQPPKVN